MSRRLILLGCVVSAAWLWAADQGWAQMFGSRTLGRTLVGRPNSGGSDADTGTLTGSERFLRGNRQRTQFVGADTADLPRFVGSVQSRTMGEVQSAMTGFRVEQGTNVNLTAAAGGLRRTNIERPRLTVGFEATGRSSEAIRQTLEQQLARSPSLASIGPVEVLVEGQTAILRGTVVSAQDAELAALVVGFEPGIDQVRNELTIAPPGQIWAPGTPPRPRRPEPANLGP